MRKISKKIVSFLIGIVMCLMAFIIIPESVNPIKITTAEAAGMTIDQLKAKFPNGKYWNHANNPGSSNAVNNQDGYTDTPCPKHGTVGTSAQTCNGFQPGGTQLSWQCMGFAEKLGYDAYGSNPRNWTKLSNMDSLKPGDIIRYKNNGHSIFVTGVNGNTITYSDCNSDGHCKIMWDKTISKSDIYGFNYVQSAPYALLGGSSTPSSHSPTGVVDSASGGAGTVSVAGWGFDPDNTGAAIDVHVYLRDSSGNMIGLGIIKADQQRDDVNNVHGCGSYHGYSGTLSTDYVGNYHVMVALIDTGNNDPTWCDGGDITITSADKTNPVVSNVYFSKITPTGFTIKCNATDDKKIKSVRVAIWINNVTEPIWHDCVSNGNDTYSFDFDISSYNNQKGPYNCHIYAYDENGNEGFGAPEPITVNCNLGDNFDALIKNPNSGKFVITSVNNDNVMLYQYISSYGSKQVWNFARNASDNSYRITSYYNHKCLDVGGDNIGKNIYTWTANNNNTQKWYIVHIGSYYKLMPACSSTRCMDVNGGYTNNRTNIQLWDFNDGGAQKFTIDKISDTTAPVIKDVKISDITKDGYKVTVTVTDNVGVKIVKVPTWTKYNSQDDLIWHEAKQTDDNTWTYTVKVSDHKNERGIYYTDVYADDFTGNQDVWHSTNNHRSTVKVGMYDLTLNPNGGTVVTESGTKTANAYKPAKNQLIYLGGNFNSMAWAKPSRTGYTLTGWFTAATGGTKVHGADGKCTNEGTYFKNGNYQKAAALTLYAQWKANSYTVTLNANGGSCDKKTISVTYDKNYETLPTPTRKGYTFTGWYTAATGGTKVKSDTKVAITANQTLYAQWKAETVAGDVNTDGKFSIADAVLLQKWLLVVPDTELADWKAGDICSDGKLNIFDLCLMKKMLINS